MDHTGGRYRHGKDLRCVRGRRLGTAAYEFRFRRTPSTLTLIIDYDDDPVPAFKTASIRVDGALVGTLLVVSTRSGDRKAIAVSLDPASVDLADLETKRSLEVSAGGHTFRMAFWAPDHMAANMERCLAFVTKH